MKAILITLLVCLAIYELVEHILLPLFWTIRYRGRKSACGPSGMIGKRCVVKQWTGTRGKVRVGGELWNAIGNSPLMPGDEGFVQGIDNLTLQVAPIGETIDTPDENLSEERSTKL
jgi:membrane protein implicated in regulation of membrane protease activity